MFSADLGVNQVASNPPATDPPFQKVALLLHGDGTNGAQNNTFVDSSSNAFTITRTGNVAQGTFSPFSLAEGQWSNYFDGSGDSVYAPDSSVIDLSSSEFTIETFVNFSNTTSCYICGQAYISSGAGSYMLWTSGGYIRFYCTTDGTTATRVDLIDSGTYSTNTWNHIAVCRSGNTLSLFVNGSRKATTTFSGTMYNDSNPFYVAAVAGVASYLTGYVSNLRVVKGSSVYDATSSTLTVPTSSLTAITNTSLLTCQSNRFKDNSSNNFTITPAGDTKVTAFSPFAPSAAYSASTNGGSGYFDANNDYLTTSSSPNLALGTGDFTIECWIYNSGLSLIGSGIILDTRTTTETNAAIEIDISNPNRFVGVYINGAYRMQVTQIVDNAWYHIALTRSGTNTRLFVNGVQSGSTYTDTINYTTQTYTVGGRYAAVSGDYRSFNGYISNLRVIKGTALYTTTFTPPTAPLTAVANTQLLLNCTNAGIFDNSGKNDIETVGNAQISTSVKKYGTGSMYFDGTGDNLKFQNNPASTPFGSESWTIEGWIYPNAGGLTYRILYTTGWPIQIYFRNSTLELYISSAAGSGVYIVNGLTGPASSIATSAWSHFAVVKNGSNYQIYVNGIGGTVATSSTDIAYPSSSFGVIGDFISGSYAYNGYIDDLRITKGQALYTSNFTPPAQAFPDV